MSELQQQQKLQDYKLIDHLERIQENSNNQLIFFILDISENIDYKTLIYLLLDYQTIIKSHTDNCQTHIHIRKEEEILYICIKFVDLQKYQISMYDLIRKIHLDFQKNVFKHNNAKQLDKDDVEDHPFFSYDFDDILMWAKQAKLSYKIFIGKHIKKYNLSIFDGSDLEDNVEFSKKLMQIIDRDVGKKKQKKEKKKKKKQQYKQPLEISQISDIVPVENNRLDSKFDQQLEIIMSQLETSQIEPQIIKKTPLKNKKNILFDSNEYSRSSNLEENSPQQVNFQKFQFNQKQPQLENANTTKKQQLINSNILEGIDLQATSNQDIKTTHKKGKDIFQAKQNIQSKNIVKSNQNFNQNISTKISSLEQQQQNNHKQVQNQLGKMMDLITSLKEQMINNNNTQKQNQLQNQNLYRLNDMLLYSWLSKEVKTTYLTIYHRNDYTNISHCQQSQNNWFDQISQILQVKYKFNDNLNVIETGLEQWKSILVKDVESEFNNNDNTLIINQL